MLGGRGIGSTGGGGGGGPIPATGAITNGGAGTTIVVPNNVSTWNVSATTSGANLYEFTPDTIPATHIVGWKSGNAPTVVAGGAWKVVNPITGDQSSATYTYGQGGNNAGESYQWTADVPNQLLWPFA